MEGDARTKTRAVAVSERLQTNDDPFLTNVERSINRKTSLFRVDFLRRRGEIATPTVQLCRADARLALRLPAKVPADSEPSHDGGSLHTGLTNRSTGCPHPVVHGAWKCTARTKRDFSTIISHNADRFENAR